MSGIHCYVYELFDVTLLSALSLIVSGGNETQMKDTVSRTSLCV